MNVYYYPMCNQLSINDNDNHCYFCVALITIPISTLMEKGCSCWGGGSMERKRADSSRARMSTISMWSSWIG